LESQSLQQRLHDRSSGGLATADDYVRLDRVSDAQLRTRRWSVPESAQIATFATLQSD